METITLNNKNTDNLLEVIKKLDKLETISESQADDLKIETKNIRVWNSRVENEVTVEFL